MANDSPWRPPLGSASRILIANALVAAIGLRDLESARHFYPTSIDLAEADELEKTLRDVVRAAMLAPEHEALRKDSEEILRVGGPVMLIPILFAALGTLDGDKGELGNVEDRMRNTVEEIRPLIFAPVTTASK